jgi:hypothetical protein
MKISTQVYRTPFRTTTLKDRHCIDDHDRSTYTETYIHCTSIFPAPTYEFRRDRFLGHDASS